MSALMRAAQAVAAMLVLAAVGFFLAAIWIVGPDSGRTAATGAVILGLAVALGFGATAWLDLNEDDQ